jgi:hypothetical protein
LLHELIATIESSEIPELVQTKNAAIARLTQQENIEPKIKGQIQTWIERVTLLRRLALDPTYLEEIVRRDFTNPLGMTFDYIKFGMRCEAVIKAAITPTRETWDGAKLVVDGVVEHVHAGGWDGKTGSSSLSEVPARLRDVLDSVEKEIRDTFSGLNPGDFRLVIPEMEGDEDFGDEEI